MRKTKSVERVEKLVELNGKMYCVFCGMICEKYTNCGTGYIEVVNVEKLKVLYELLKN